MTIDFQRQWADDWARIGLAPDEAGLSDLLARYSEPHRHYHTLQHLSECLELFQSVASEARQPGAVAIALWFHDAIYDVHRHDNEKRSAQLAVSCLTSAGAAHRLAEEVRRLIMATKHSHIPDDHDAQVLVDIDLSILGAMPARFREYQAQVRAEYAWVPSLQFHTKRRSILRSFLDRPVLYHTAALRELFEARARSNLANSLDKNEA